MCLKISVSIEIHSLIIMVNQGNSEQIHDPYLVSDLIKQQMALSNYNEIEIDLFIVFPSPTQ
jgi:hypothetical protein